MKKYGVGGFEGKALYFVSVEGGRTTNGGGGTGLQMTGALEWNWHISFISS